MRKLIYTLILMLSMSLGKAVGQNTYDLWVGESTYLYAPSTPAGTALNKTAWGCDEANVSISRFGDNVKVTVTGYFSGRARVQCDYYYYGYIYGKMYTGNSTEYYFITCKQGKITLNKESATLNIGETLQLKESISSSGGYTKPTVSWTSSNSSVATVTSSGLVKAVSSGIATITARSSHGSSATCMITVNRKDVSATGIGIPENVEMIVGQSTTLQATLEPSDATNAITWSSSDEKIATVSQFGFVKAMQVGTVTIKAKTDNGHTASSRIKVLARSQEEVDKENASKIASAKKRVDNFINNIINAFGIW